MFTKTSKKFLVAVLSVLLGICCIIGAYGIMGKKASADTTTASDVEGEFIMEKGAQARIIQTGGIQFTAYFDQTFKDNVISGNDYNSGYSLGMIVVPSYYVEDYNNYVSTFGYEGGYYEYFRDVKGKMIDITFDVSDIGQIPTEGSPYYGYYAVRGAVTNMKGNNLDTEYVGIAYLNVNDTYKYAGQSLPRTVKYVAASAIKQYADLGLSEFTQSLSDLYFGGSVTVASYKVNYNVMTSAGDYIVDKNLSEYKYAEVGSTINYTPVVIDGYEFNPSKSVISIEVDGSADIDLYYDLIDGYMVRENGNPASDWGVAIVGTSTSYTYGEEAYSTKIGFRILADLGNGCANFKVTGDSSCGSYTFYLKNMTGKVLEIYSDPSKFSAVTEISDSTDWQKVILYANPEEDTNAVYLRTKDTSTFDTEEYVYISEINSKIPDIGTIMDYEDVENASIWESSITAIEKSSEKQFDGKDTIKLSFPEGNGASRYGSAFYIGKRYSWYSNGWFAKTGVELERLFAVEGVTSVTLSFSYNASGITGGKCEHIGIMDVQDYAIVLSDTWTTLNITLTEVPANPILYVSRNANLGWSGDVWNQISGCMYITPIEYKLNYEDPDMGDVVVPTDAFKDQGTYLALSSSTAGLSGWQGVSNGLGEVSSEVKFNGNNTLKFTFNFSDSYGAGVFFDSTRLSEMLNRNGVTSVTLSFNYNYTSADGDNANYIGLSVGNAWDAVLDKTEGFHPFSYTFTSMPQYAILHVGSGNGCPWGSANGIFGTLYVSDIDYKVNYQEGLYKSSDTLDGVSMWAWNNFTVSNDVKFNGKPTIAITPTGSYTSGCYFDKTLLTNLLGLEGVTSVDLSFNYKIDDGFNWLATYMCLGLGNAINISDYYNNMAKYASWQKATFNYTSVPENFILAIGMAPDMPWSSSGIGNGTFYISDIEYKVNYEDEKGEIESIPTEYTPALSSIGSGWTATPAVVADPAGIYGNVLQTNTTGANFANGFMLNDAVKSEMQKLLDMSKLGYITVSFDYYVDSTTYGSYIACGNQDSTSTVNGAGHGVQIKGTGAWYHYETTFTSIDSPYIFVGLFLGETQPWSNSIFFTSNFYIANFKVNAMTGEGLYKSSDTIDGLSVWAWNNFSVSDDVKFNGKPTIAITPTGSYTSGCYFDKTLLTNLLSLENVASVDLSFNYKIDGGFNWLATYMCLGLGNAINIADYYNNMAKYANWQKATFNYTSVPKDFILAIGMGPDMPWSGSGIGNGTFYISDIEYKVNFKNAKSGNYATESVEKVFGFAHGTDAYSTKVGVEILSKSANLQFIANSSISTGILEFYFLNKTGKELIISSDIAGSDVTVKVSNKWQRVQLAVSNTDTVLNLYVKSANGFAISNNEVTYFYLSCPFAGSEDVFDLDSLDILKDAQGEGISEDYEIVYSVYASDSEKAAAEKLAEIMTEAVVNDLGINFIPVTNAKMDKKKHHIFIGNDFAETTPDANWTSDDSYTIKKVDGNVYIYGKTDRGTYYGVLDFLNKYFGYEVYNLDYEVEDKTAPLAGSLVYALNYEIASVTYGDIEEITFNPTVAERAYLAYGTIISKWNGTVTQNGNEELIVAMRNNSGEWDSRRWPTDSPVIQKAGGLINSGFYTANTHNSFYTLEAGVNIYNQMNQSSISANTFSVEVNGEGLREVNWTKKADGTSSVELVALALGAKVIEGYKYIVFEQMDVADGFCSCADCSYLASELGGKSGVLIWFVNQVIDYMDNVMGLADVDYYVSTFAYLWSQTAPTKSASHNGMYDFNKMFTNKACDKLIVKFAFLNAEFDRGMLDENFSQYDNLTKWQNFIGEKTAFWLYDTDYGYYPGYFPSLKAIADNAYAMKVLGCEYVIIEGVFNAPHDWDSELRRYIYSKMLYNFDEAKYLEGDKNSNGINDYTEELAMEYLNFYFGEGNGELVWSIISCYENSTTAGKAKHGYNNYKLGKQFYIDRFSNIFFGDNDSTGLLLAEDGEDYLGNTIPYVTRLKYVALSIVADLYYLGGAGNYDNADVEGYFGTTNTYNIFMALCEELGYTQYSEENPINFGD